MDSLTRVEFAMAVEEAFGVEIEDDEAGRIKTVGQAAETVASLLVSQVSRTWQDLLAAGMVLLPTLIWRRLRRQGARPAWDVLLIDAGRADRYRGLSGGD